MANIQLFRCAVFILIVVMMSYSDDSCGDVKITSPVSNTVNVSVNDWLKMTFTLNTENCSSPAYVITVEKTEQGRPMIICRIHHNQTCIKTGHENTYSCRCVSPSGAVEFWDKLVRPGDVEYRWRWTDFLTGKHGEKKINYHVAIGDKQKDEHLQMMEFILGGVCGLLVVVIAVILISARCRKSSPSAATENRKEQDTPLDSVQLTRPNPQTQAPVAGGNYRQETRCNQPFIVEDEYARVVRDPRRKPPAPRQVQQQETMDMFINDLYDEKAL